MGGQAGDGLAERIRFDPGHGRHLLGPGGRREGRARDGIDHLRRDGGRGAAGVQGREPGRAPRVVAEVPSRPKAGLVARRARLRTLAGCRSDGVLGDHAAERKADEVGQLSADGIEQPGDGIGQSVEGQWSRQRRRRSVARQSHATTRRAVGQRRELRLPGRAAAAEAVQQHDHRPLPGLPPGDRAVHVGAVAPHRPTLAATRPFVNGVDLFGRRPPDSAHGADAGRAGGDGGGARADHGGTGLHVRPRGDLPVGELPGLPRPWPAGPVRAHRLRRTRRRSRRLRAGVRGDRAPLRCDGADVQHARGHDALDGSGGRPPGP